MRWEPLEAYFLQKEKADNPPKATQASSVTLLRLLAATMAEGSPECWSGFVKRSRHRRKTRRLIGICFYCVSNCLWQSLHFFKVL
jgi:hypothetical protein